MTERASTSIADRLYYIGDDWLAFHCPGCEYSHAVTVNGRRNDRGASWTWNGSLVVPTFSPSLNVWADDPKLRCHSFVRDGMIEFLPDCFHKLKATTAIIPAWESV